MTPVGHSLFGISVAILCIPKLKTIWAKALFLMSFVLLANIPDFPITGWGHKQYHVSHSLFVNLAMIVVIVVVLSLWNNVRELIGGKRVILGGAIAWLSHFLLDSFYNHGLGIAIYWPFGDGVLALPMPWFSKLQVSTLPFNAHTIKVYLVEFLFYFSLLLISIYLRKKSYMK